MAAEIPDVVHQLLLWHATLSAVKCAGGVILLGILLTIDIKIGHWHERYIKRKPWVEWMIQHLKETT